MAKRLFVFFMALIIAITPPKRAEADMFGGDVVILVQILANAVQQLIQLKQLLGTGKDTLGLLEDINHGINDSLNLIRTVSPNTDPGIYRDLVKVQDALQKFQSVYGAVVPSLDAGVQQETDQNVAEAVALNNSIYSYTREIDEIGEQVKRYSHSTSPGGAQKLTAQTLGVMLTVMNTQLRAQATGLKLQAQNLALGNKKDKEETRHLLDVTHTLKTAMKTEKSDFLVPRF